MEDPVFVKFLIGFTISDDDTRVKFEKGLEEKFGERIFWVNESMFVLTGGDLDGVRKKLNGICKEVQKLELKENDFIKLYYAAHLGNYKNKPEVDKIIEETIW